MQSQVITGPCAITYNSKTYFSQGDVVVNFNRNMTSLTASHLGTYDSRQRETTITVQFTPVGQTPILDAMLGLISGKMPGQSMVPGGLSSTTYAATGVAATNVITATGHTFTNGDLVAFSAISGGSGLAIENRYYVRDVSGDTFKLATTSGGSAIDFTTDITSGTIAAVVEKALVIQPLHNAGNTSKIWTFHRAGLTALGDFTLSATAQVNGQVTFTTLESAVVPGSWYATAAYSAPSSGLLDDFESTNVITPPSYLYWAADPTSLVSGDYQLVSEDGWRVSMGLSVTSHYREKIGIADVTFADFNCTVSGKLANIYDYQENVVNEGSITAAMPFLGTRPGQRATRKKLSLVAINDDSTEGAAGAQSGDLLLQFVAAEFTACDLNWSGSTNRTGNATFTCVPIISSGVRTYLTSSFEL